jgi:cytochrome c oxidase assembly protein subunit 15
MAAQGTLGYVQYFRRIPAVLVGFHVFGAVIVFVCAQELIFAMYGAPSPSEVASARCAPLS